jgi:deoxyribodipyrimidine photo-lyase
LTDNQALAAALAHADGVIPVFVLDPTLLNSPYVGPKRVAFLLGGLRRLDGDLRARGSRLIVRRGDPRDELIALLAEYGAEAIFTEEDFTPYSRQRDDGVAERLPLHLVGGRIVHLPGAVLKADGTPYTVFTPFSRRWKTLPPPQASTILPAPDRLPAPREVGSLPIPEEPALPPTVPFQPGEAEAQRRLRAFVEGDDPPIYQYAEARDRLDVDGTSRLSPYLHLGMLSTRQAVVAALEGIAAAPDAESRQGAETWLNELVWREFFVHILYHFPHVLEHSFRANLRAVPWENDKESFVAWCEGQTGYPVVDAAMRQLVETGWMHNRARMIVASFLVKDLLIDWRWGERYFMQHLVDGDSASNNGGWQWTAGTGTDQNWPRCPTGSSISRGRCPPRCSKRGAASSGRTIPRPSWTTSGHGSGHWRPTPRPGEDRINEEIHGLIREGRRPPRYDAEEAFTLICHAAQIVQAHLPVRLLLENVPHWPLPEVDVVVMPDFIGRVLEETQCGLLLDIPHACITAATLDHDVRSYLEEFPLDRTIEVHVSGVRCENGQWAGSHEPLQDEDYALLEWLLQRSAPRANREKSGNDS